MVADLARRCRIEAGRPPAHGAAGALRDQIGELRGEPVLGIADATGSGGGIAKHQKRNRRCHAGEIMHDRPCAGNMGWCGDATPSPCQT